MIKSTPDYLFHVEVLDVDGAKGWVRKRSLAAPPVNIVVLQVGSRVVGKTKTVVPIGDDGYAAPSGSALGFNIDFEADKVLDGLPFLLINGLQELAVFEFGVPSIRIGDLVAVRFPPLRELASVIKYACSSSDLLGLAHLSAVLGGPVDGRGCICFIVRDQTRSIYIELEAKSLGNLRFTVLRDQIGQSGNYRIRLGRLLRPQRSVKDKFKTETVRRVLTS